MQRPERHPVVDILRNVQGLKLWWSYNVHCGRRVKHASRPWRENALSSAGFEFKDVFSHACDDASPNLFLDPFLLSKTDGLSR